MGAVAASKSACSAEAPPAHCARGRPRARRRVHLYLCPTHSIWPSRRRCGPCRPDPRGAVRSAV